MRALLLLPRGILVLSVALAACSGGESPGGDAGPTTDAASDAGPDSSPADLPGEAGPCNSACAPAGRTLCDGAALLTCGDPDGDGCLDWSAPVPCAGACLDGVCRDCTPGCTAPGARKCSGNTVQFCGDPDGNGCLDWDGDDDCGALVCSNGFCATTCLDECTVAGARTCDGTGVKTCAETDGDGCLEWGDVVPCGGGTVCSNGSCAQACKDECTIQGARQCDDVNLGVQTCGDGNGDGCLEWSDAVPCDEGQVCSGGACGTTCKDECPAVNARTCDDAKTGVRLCASTPAGCLAWGSASPCGEGEVCSNGNCAQDCTDECTVSGARRCGGTGAAWQACGDANGDGCLEWGSLVACEAGETCSSGNCQVACQAECNVQGARKCGDAGTGWRACDDANGDGCLEWGGEIACDEGQVCSNGNCATTCQSECTAVGARQCDGAGGFQVCGDPDGDGCLSWGTTDACNAGETCSNGLCALTCQDECDTAGARDCDDAGLGTRTCGQHDDDPCLEWSTATACPSPQVCSGGSCTLTCEDACSPSGQAACDAGADGFRVCGIGASGCLDWGSLTPCGLAADCQDGACQAKPVPGTVRIQEVFYDPAGTDNGCFVELKGPAGLDLGGFELVGVNGANGADYNTIALTGTIPADGLFVVAQAAIAYADQVSSKANYENGPDSVQLRWGAQIVDALGYGDFGGGQYAGEGKAAPDVASGHSLGREANGLDTNDNASDFLDLAAPTPGAPNTAAPDQDPVASFTATVLDGQQVRVDAAASSDAETPAADLRLRWDWQDDGTFDTGWTTTRVETHAYATAGTYTIRLEVQDGAGNTAATTRTVDVAAVQNIKAEILTSTWSGRVNLTGNAWVAAGNTLTINPGTLVTVTGDFTFEIKGKVLVKGDPGAEVTFTSSAGTVGAWAGIVLPAGTQDHFFDYTIIEHARKGLAVAAPGNVTNTVLRQNVDGMVVTECAAGLVVTSVTATQNRDHGLVVAGCNGNDFQHVTASFNGLEGVKVDEARSLILSNCRIEDNQADGMIANRSNVDLRHCQVARNRYGIRTGGETLTVSDSRIVENRREGFYLWDEYQYSYRLEAVSVTNSDLSGNGTEARSRLADETTTVKSSTANYTIEDVYTTPVTAPDAGTLTLVQVDYDETDYSPGMTVYGYLMLGAEGTTSIRTIDGDAKNYWIEVPAGVTTVRGKINDRYQPSYATFTFTKLLYHAPVAAVPDPVEVVTGAMNCAPQFQSNWWGTTDPTGILARITNVGYAPNTSTPLAAPPVGAGVQP